jgi:tetratricopeptide (TPR) repeat protein
VNKVVAGLWFVLAVLSVHGDEYRIFTDMQGRAIEAKLLEVDTSRKRIRLERTDGRKVWVSPSLFSEEDKAYIQKWVRTQTAFTEKNLKISMERINEEVDSSVFYGQKPSKNQLESSAYQLPLKWAEKEEQLHFDVRLKNESADPIEGFRIEYRYFIRMVRLGGGLDDVWSQVSGYIEMESINPGEEKLISTAPVILGNYYRTASEKTGSKYGNGTYEYDNRAVKIGRDQLEGIWLKISDLVGGSSVLREVSMPTDYYKKKEWNASVFRTTTAALYGPETLEEIKLRGRAEDLEQFQKWMRLFESKFPLMSTKEKRVQLEGLNFYYEAEYDPKGKYAYMIASHCRLRDLAPEAAKWYQTLLETDDPLEHQRMGAYLMLGVIYSSGPDETVYDGAKAVHYAQLAVEMDSKSWSAYDVLAAAYARNGQFDLAIQAENEAIKLVKNGSTTQEQYRERLALYQSGKPYTSEYE